MRFEWNDSCSEIGHYEVYLYDDDGKKLDEMWIRDYTNSWMKRHDVQNRIHRDYAFEVGYCNGFSMHQGFDKCVSDGYGYCGTPESTIESVKEWCERYLAGLYIKAYKDAAATIEAKKRRHDWFVENGFS